ncbi:MAG: glycosyltransferase family 2 protein [Gemmatimonadota bacterium]|nr:glycosyltransferase family 2 protein [Gemmatimonadota bacterium]
MDSNPEYSFVLPIYDEEETLPRLCERLRGVLERLDGTAEVIFVDDGSQDGSFALMAEIAARDPRFKVLQLSRNFGHQIAITAGLDHASGEAIVVMDADLQDPPEVALAMAQRWREGFEVVYAIREHRAGESRFKLLTAAFFYRLLRKLTRVQIPSDVGDFRLVDRKALDAYRAMRENNRFVRGMFSWIGFRQTGVRYSRAARFAGRTKYPLRKMIKFAADGIISFSSAPLRLALNFGFVVSIASFLGGITALLLKFADVFVIPGWASLVFVTSFLGGVQLVVLGVIGEYVARVYDETKNRPLYIVSTSIGLGELAEDLKRAIWSIPRREPPGAERVSRE